MPSLSLDLRSDCSAEGDWNAWPTGKPLSADAGDGRHATGAIGISRKRVESRNILSGCDLRISLRRADWGQVVPRQWADCRSGQAWFDPLGTTVFNPLGMKETPDWAVVGFAARRQTRGRKHYPLLGGRVPGWSLRHSDEDHQGAETQIISQSDKHEST